MIFRSKEIDLSGIEQALSHVGLESIDQIDLVNPSLMEAYKLINQTLLDDAEYEHLNKQAREVLNAALADIAMIIVRTASNPSFIVKTK
jgi:hypothetical protein